METIKLGKREVNKDQFIQAVANAKKVSDISIAIGFNPTPTSTIANVRNMVESLGLDTTHIKGYNRRATEEAKQNSIKQFNLTTTNQKYYDSFLPTIAERSMPTYKASCGNFLELIDSQDFITVTPEQILAFANTKNSEATKQNVIAHIKSMMVNSINNDVNGAIEKVSKQMLVWLIRK